MRAGLLRDRITVQKHTLTSDGAGGFLPEPEWSNLTGGVRIPARVRPLQGEEKIRAMQTQGDVTHEVEIRFLPGVKPEHRILFHAPGGDRTLHIVSAPVITGQNEGVQFMAREGA